jgi:hypothetical protein
MPKKTTPLPEQVLSTQKRIELWRSEISKRRRIPEEFWNEAAELACKFGVNRISEALRLKYETLKTRANAACSQVPSRTSSLPSGPSSFVEVVGQI